MGVFDKAEGRIESAVGRVFARVFKGYVQPPEICSRIQRELDQESVLLSRDKRLVPNAFLVSLSAEDYDRLVPGAKTVNAELLPAIRQYATENSYVFNGPLSIDYEKDTSLRTGEFKLSSRTLSGGNHDGQALRPGRMVLEVDGVRHPLTPPGLVIGRGSDADLRLNDPGISRRHAKITVTGTPEQPLIGIEDLGSTNGLLVNGQRIYKTRLGEGSRIEIGNTRMLIHTPTEG